MWTRPLFGKSPAGTPAGEIGMRVRRIHAAGSLDVYPAVLIGYCVGAVIFLAEFMVTIGAAITGNGASLLTGVRDFLGGLMRAADPWSVALPIAVIVLLMVAVPRLSRWSFDRRAASASNEQLTRWRQQRRRMARTVRRIGVGFAVVLILIGATMGWVSVLAALAKGAASFGGALAALGVFGRRGTRLVCARCDYPMCTWRGAPEECPECGTRWRDPWRARFGRRAARPRWIGGGLALIAASALLMTIVGVCGFGGR